jgi:hypothetical protein
VRMDLRGELPTLHGWSVRGDDATAVALRR